jgi:hypothetical protein
MRKMLFALAVIMAGAFAFAAGSSPASAMTAGSVTSMSDIVKGSGLDKVTYYYRRGGGYCYYYPWRCRRHHYRRHHHHYRPWWRRRHYW